MVYMHVSVPAVGIEGLDQDIRLYSCLVCNLIWSFLFCYQSSLSHSTKMTAFNFKIGHGRFQVHPANFVLAVHTTLYYVIDTVSLKPFTTNEYVHFVIFLFIYK
jgi:hypothetical protein